MKGSTMKKEILLCLGLLMFICNCNPKNRNEEKIIVKKENSNLISTDTLKRQTVEMQLHPAVLSDPQKEVVLKITNHLNVPVSFGCDMLLEYYNEDSSCWVNALPEKYAYNLLKYELAPDKVCEMPVSLLGNRKPGRYKITKKFYRTTAPQSSPYMESVQLDLLQVASE